MSRNPSNVHNLQPVGPAVITQRRMLDFMALEVNFKLIKQRYEDERKELVRLLEEVTTEQEDGQFIVVLEETERRNVAWRKEFERECGELMALEIIANTAPDKSKTPKIKAKPTIKI